MSIVTVSELKAFIDPNETSAANDTLLGTIIGIVEKQVESYLGREIATGTHTEYYDIDYHQDALHLRHTPVTSVTSIHDCLDYEYDAADLVDSSDYTLFSTDGIVQLKSGYFSEGRRTVKVIYVGGWADGSEPADMLGAIMLQCAYLYQHRNDLGAKQISLGAPGLGTISKASEEALIPQVQRMLDPYVWMEQ